MEQAYNHLHASIALLLLIVVAGLIIWSRIRSWNARRQAWRDAELETMKRFEAIERSRLGRRVTDLPSIATPVAR